MYPFYFLTPPGDALLTLWADDRIRRLAARLPGADSVQTELKNDKVSVWGHYLQRPPCTTQLYHLPGTVSVVFAGLGEAQVAAHVADVTIGTPCKGIKIMLDKCALGNGFVIPFSVFVVFAKLCRALKEACSFAAAFDFLHIFPLHTLASSTQLLPMHPWPLAQSPLSEQIPVTQNPPEHL